jgi:transcriptional regulator with XRE-family HTH domain
VREDAGYTQVQLADLMGQTQTYVSKCERGQRRVDVVEFRKFCFYLKISPAQFLDQLDREISGNQKRAEESRTS